MIYIQRNATDKAGDSKRVINNGSLSGYRWAERLDRVCFGSPVRGRETRRLGIVGAGPFFPPGCPAMPAPEFWLLGDVWVCARAGNATMASMAMAPVRRIILGSRASIAPVELQNRCSVPDHGSPASYAGSIVLRKNRAAPGNERRTSQR